MKILLTGANGYIGTRLLQSLAEADHKIIALVRSKYRIKIPSHLQDNVQVIEGDLLDINSLKNIPKEIDAAYYLVHSMGNQSSGFSELEIKCAKNFMSFIKTTTACQIIYLGGLARENKISEHMQSRKKVEKILSESSIPLTVLQAAIVIGAGSLSFEIIRDLVEKLPLMIAPRWVYSRCQPISILDVVYYLQNVLLNDKCLGKTFEIGGPDVLTYKDMLIRLAKFRKLKRYIIPVPVLTPYLSSLWLYFITSTNFSIAKALVSSLKTDAVCKENTIKKIFSKKCLSYDSSIELAFKKIEQNAIVSGWKDAMIRSRLNPNLKEYIEVPTHACVKEVHDKTYLVSKDQVIERLWSIGGKKGWYYMNFAWSIRGFIDRLCGGVGLKRGRTHLKDLKNGDVLDFWRVLLADKTKGHLLLYSEMKLPGEAWLEWKIDGNRNKTRIIQTATFRPKGVLGRVYWYALMPFHKLIFHGLCDLLGEK